MSVEGIPNGWRLVRVGRVHNGETRIDSNGNPLKWLGGEPSKSKNLVIIEMIKDSKQYREPDLSDLANGPIEIEACTPDPHTGERRWRKRKLVAIQTESRRPFVVQHPNQPGLVVCYKEARIEVVASSEASPADHIADANKMVPPAIPAGWRELDESDHIEQSDKYDDGNRWMPYTYDPASPKSVRFDKSIHVRHIRKIKAPATDHIADANKMAPPAGYRLLDKSAKVEPRKAGDLYWSCSVDDWVELAEFGVEYANRDDWPACRKAEQVHHVKVTIYREPTQRDLANGPIRCRVRDSKEDRWLDRDLHAVMPETVIGRFVTISEDKRNVGSWVYCEIPSDHQAIRVGDLVRVTARQVGVYRVGWVNEMNRQVNKVAKVAGITHDGRFLLNGCGGWRFHRDWLELVETTSEAKGGEA